MLKYNSSTVMKYFLLTSFVLALYCFLNIPSAQAQSIPADFKPVYPQPTPNTLYEVSCVGQATCYAVGGGGTILKSTDAGLQWLDISPSYTPTLRAITCTDTQTCYTVGAQGLALKTTNGGSSWISQTTPVTSNLTAISCASTVCYAVGGLLINEEGVVLKLTNGQNWQRLIAPVSSNLYAINCPTDLTCYMTADRVYKTTNGGASWGPLTAISSGNFNPSSIVCFTESNCYISTDWAVYKTTNGGTDWIMKNLNQSISSLACATPNDCYATSNNSSKSAVVFSTHDSWESWQVQPLDFYQPLVSTSCLTPNACVAVGGYFFDNFAGGTVIAGTTNGGKTWTRRNDGLAQPLQGVACPIETICYSVGGRGEILKSSDSGLSWYALVTPTAETFYSISCPSQLVCVTVGERGKILYTQNGGTNWLSIPALSNPVDLYKVVCTSVSRCMTVGANGAIFSSGAVLGNSWTSESSGVTATLRNIACPAVGVCYAVGENGTILKKANGVWTQQTTAATQSLQGLSCPTVTNCYILQQGKDGVSEQAILIKTTNGSTWISQTVSFYLYDPVLYCLDSATCYAGNGSHATYVGSPKGSVVYSTTNSGVTWNESWLSADFPTLINDLTCTTALHCIVVGTEGMLKITTNGKDWSSNYYALYNYLLNIQCKGNNCYAIGQAGSGSVILVSKDKGLSWQKILFPTNRNLFGLTCPAELVCYASGNDEPVLKTVDGGTTWQLLPSNPSVIRVECATALLCYGQSSFWETPAYFWRSSDGGQTWISKTYTLPDSPASYGAMTCPSARVCYLVAGYGTSQDKNGNVYKTADAGLSWQQVYTSPTPNTGGYFFLSCPDELTCYIPRAGGNTNMLKTADGGATWNLLTNAAGGPISCITSQDCFLPFYFGFIYTADGGANWYLQDWKLAQGVLNASCTSELICFAVGGSGSIMRGSMACYTKIAVTSALDDGGCGTLRKVLERTPANSTLLIRPGSTQPTSLALNSALTIPAGISLQGACGNNGPQVTINAVNNVSLSISGGTSLHGLLLKGIRLLAQPGARGTNHLSCVAVRKAS